MLYYRGGKEGLDLKNTDGRNITAGGALLARLKAVGVDYIFANSGTDFPPIIEGLAEASAKDIPLPKTVTVPHESAAVGMAHGYFLATGRAQAVMVHTNVGLANCSMGAINAATERVPMLLFSGRTPVTEKSRFGGRTVPIGWGQEMRDQSALVREACKWEYELKFPEQAVDIVDRALAVATSTPKGPVYLSLPREVLCEPCPSTALSLPATIAASISAPPRDALEAAAKLLANAKNPLVIAQRGPDSDTAFNVLGVIANDWGIPVVQYWMISPSISGDHPMNCGGDLEPWLSSADVIVVIDCLAPWSPAIHTPMPDVNIIHIGEDPLYSRFPIRNFASNLSLPGPTGATLLSLAEALQPLHASRAAANTARRQLIADKSRELRNGLVQKAYQGALGPMSKEWVSHCLSEAIKDRVATVFSELGCLAETYRANDRRGWFQEPHSGGLGWALPAALGMQLADMDRLVVATMGDGSYMFANPVACHQIAEAYQIPLLVLVLNNASWGAVRQSVTGLYPNGFAARTNAMPLVTLSPAPDFTKIAEASRGWAKRVETGEDLPAALEEALGIVLGERRLALLDIQLRG